MDLNIIKNVRRTWIEQLFELSHESAQKTISLNPKYVGWTLTEAIGMYFYSLDLDSGYKAFVDWGYATDEEAKIWNEFHQKFVDYRRPEKICLSDDKVLLDPEWKNLRNIGYEAWQKFKTLISDLEEIDLIEELENDSYK